MTFYAQLISTATGVTDPADLAEIEEYMRHVVWHSTLDWQTREQLEASAVVAWDECRMVRAMVADPTLAPDCNIDTEAFQLLLAALGEPTQGVSA